jgi:acyl-CoA thioester hydrolase
MITPAKIQVRFADCDMMGHVNNAVYLSYFEQTRMHYFGQLLDDQWDWKKQGVILVKNEVTYLKPILLHNNVEIYAYLKAVGKTSFTLSYKVRANDVICALGASKVVCYDFYKQEPSPVYPEIVKALEQLERDTNDL